MPDFFSRLSDLTAAGKPADAIEFAVGELEERLISCDYAGANEMLASVDNGKIHGAAKDVADVLYHCVAFTRNASHLLPARADLLERVKAVTLESLGREQTSELLDVQTVTPLEYPFPTQAIVEAIRGGRPKNAIALLHLSLGGMVEDGNFGEIDALFATLDLDGFDETCALALLGGTAGLGYLIPSRAGLVARMRPWLGEKIGERATAEIDKREVSPRRQSRPKPEPAKRPFNAETYRELLGKIASDPPGDGVLSSGILGLVREHVASGMPNEADVWNAYKHLLDMVVHTSGANGFIMTLLDLEALYAAPAGGYAQADRSISNAPWRKTRDVS